jgi:phosphoglycolate phosphatase
MSSEPNIIFDLDGTLVDSAPSLCKAGNFLLSKLDRPKIDVETYKTFIGKGLLKQIEQLLVHTGGLPIGELDKHFKLFCDFYNSNALKSTSVYEGVHDALKSLKSMPSKLAICTQKMEKPARAVLGGFDLDQYFDGFSFGDSLSVMKPNPKMVTYSTRSFKKGPLIYVGDSEIDAVTAQNAGATFLLFSGGYRTSSIEEIDCYAVFDSHAELLPLVEKILTDGI